MSCESPESRIERALHDSSPSKALAALAGALKAEGMTQREMYELFDGYRARHESDRDQSLYDAILDTMDIISGWCAPSARLFETELHR